MAGLTRRAVVLAKIQSAQGVAAVPSPFLNAILVSDMSFSCNGQVIERQFLRDSLSRIPHRMGRIQFEANFSFEWKSGPDLGVRPEWSPLMRAGGYSETRNATLTSIRTAALQWTTTGSGTAEFFVELAGGGDGSITLPDGVLENGEDMTRGTAGSLKPGQWDFGVQGAFSTIKVRLSDDADPDSKALAYVQSVAGTSIVYTPRDTGHEYATVYIYPDGLQIVCVDSVLDWTRTYNAGQTAIVQCRLQSNYATPTDVAIPAVVNYQSHLPPIVENMAFTVGGFAGVLPNISIQGGNQIVPREDINSPDGLKSLRIAGRTLTGTMAIEQELVATMPFFTRYDAATEMVASAVLGTTPQRISHSWPNIQFSSIQSADFNGLRGLNIGLAFNEDVAQSLKEETITLD